MGEIKELENEIKELKEEQQAFIEVCQMPCKDCKINELKERLDKKDQYYNIEHNPAMESDFDWKVGIINRIINIEEVLREQYKFRIKWSEKAIFVDGAERLSLDQVIHLKDQIRFYGVLLEKLDSNSEVDYGEWTKKRNYNINYLNIGELIRFKDDLLKSKRINESESDIITNYLTLLMGEED